MSIDDVLQHPAVLTFDRRVDTAFARLRGNRTADRAMYALSEAANHSLLWHGVVVAGAVSRGRRDGAPAGFRHAARLGSAIGAESAVVNGGIKRLFRRERPVHDGDRPHRLRTPRTSSFPSGHATSGFFAAVVFSDTHGRAPVWYSLASLVAVSRIHVRIHHASDVVAGAALGYALGRVARSVLTTTAR